MTAQCFVSSRHRFPSSHSVTLPFVTLFTIYRQSDVSICRPHVDPTLNLLNSMGDEFVPVSDHIFSSIATTPRSRHGLQQGKIIALLLCRRQKRVMRRRRQLWVRSIFSQRQQQGSSIIYRKCKLFVVHGACS